MKNINFKDKRVIAVLVLFSVVLVGAIGATFAFFSIQVNGNDNAKNIIVETAYLELLYVDGPEIKMENAYPGEYITKTVHVTNKSTKAVVYTFDMKEYVNTFTNDEFVVSYTCTSYENYGGSSEAVSGTCEGLPETVMTSESSIVKEGILIGVGITQEITITFKFKETGSNQDSNQGKNFSGLLNVEESKDIFAVSYLIDNKIIYSESVKKGEDVQNVPEITTKGNYSSEWNNDGKNIESGLEIYAMYYYNLTFIPYNDTTNDNSSIDNSSYKLYESSGNILKTDGNTIKVNSSVIATVAANNGYVFNLWLGADSDGEYEITKDTAINYSVIVDVSNCIIKGSKISMADGTIKNVEDIKIGDEILGYNYYNGSISNTKVYSVISRKHSANVFTVKLEDGHEIQIVGFEYLFDTDKKEYIPINLQNYKKALNKSVMINENGKISSSKVISITHDVEEVEHYTMYSEKFINYIANNIIVHIDVDFVNDRYKIDNNFKVDMNIYNADVKKYGTYTYDDFKDVCSKEMFDNLVLKDFKIVVGKGLITFDELKNGIKILQEEIDYYNNIEKE